MANNNIKVANADAVYLRVESNNATDVTSCFSVLQALKLDWLRRTGYVHKAVFIAELHVAEGGARDVAGRGSPAGNAIGPVRQTWAGGVFAGLIRRCNFVSVLLEKKKSHICDDVHKCASRLGTPGPASYYPRLRLCPNVVRNPLQC